MLQLSTQSYLLLPREAAYQWTVEANLCNLNLPIPISNTRKGIHTNDLYSIKHRTKINIIKFWVVSTITFQTWSSPNNYKQFKGQKENQERLQNLTLPAWRARKYPLGLASKTCLGIRKFAPGAFIIFTALTPQQQRMQRLKHQYSTRMTNPATTKGAPTRSQCCSLSFLVSGGETSSTRPTKNRPKFSSIKNSCFSFSTRLFIISSAPTAFSFACVLFIMIVLPSPIPFIFSCRLPMIISVLSPIFPCSIPNPQVKSKDNNTPLKGGSVVKGD